MVKTDDRDQPRPNAVPWPPLLLALAIAGAIGLGWAVPVPWFGVDDMPARVIGYGIGCSGLALAGWAIVTMAKARANILPHRPATALITSGPFRIWRHPIYMADVLILLGLAQVTLNLWFVPAAAVFAVLVTVLAIIPEERHLAAQFGDDYLTWSGRTRRWF
ncbi:MAG: methyltransferase family protein [Hyphomicrobiaceae bacterium]|jgi:protein-S-isoprenylcysteine O-methyltransferase Ste14